MASPTPDDPPDQPDDPPSDLSPADAERLLWSARLLPLMTWMVLGLTLFFFIASAAQLTYLHLEIRKSPQPDLSQPLAALLDGTVSTKNTARQQNARVAVLSTLELSAMNYRYHQANVALLSRVWMRYLGFVTGMVLAMVGAVFILGRLQDQGSTASAKSAGGSFTFKTASPGLILSALGVVLMLTTITTHHEIAVSDQAIFIKGEAQSITAPAATTRQKRDTGKKSGAGVRR